jgi:hypothetical protein
MLQGFDCLKLILKIRIISIITILKHMECATEDVYVSFAQKSAIFITKQTLKALDFR